MTTTTPPEDSSDSDSAQRYADALRKAREGSVHALDEVVEELSGMLWRVARGQGLDPAAAEDVVQTTWLTLVRSLHQIGTPESLPAWLAVTAKHEAWKVSKHGGRERPTGQDWEVFPAEEPGVDEDVVDRMGLSTHHHKLWDAVAGLSRRCRQLLQVVAYVERPDYGEVAAALGVPRGSVGPYRGRCLSQLRERLERDPQSETSEGNT